MGAGLDELIESLLTEIAFSGVRGCSVSSLLTAIDSFYKNSDDGREGGAPDNSQGKSNYAANIDPQLESHLDPRLGEESRAIHGENHDLAVASKVWGWLASRSDVSVGDDRRFNHLSLEEVLDLPEEEEPVLPGAADKSSDQAGAPSAPSIQTPSRPRQGRCSSGDENLSVRPRLHVSEERQWRTITGHGRDFKRVPLFEWRALVDIASVKGKGILQGDLVRLTGQDKRSLPTRTDALARKGYIIKQPVVLRGGKSSKLWLTQFVENAKEDQESEGLDYETVDLSKAALTSDLQPVPFCEKWNRDHIDYLALAQAFVAIVKAWELIRYCDARSKLGVEERVRQMRALAKTCRWLTNIGALSFVGAKFAGSNRLFKDCVKFIRDPAPAEWAHFRTTPKTRMAIPSGRIGKRGEASRAVHASSQLGGPRGKGTPKKSKSTKSKQSITPPQTSTITPPWKPQKPVPNTAFEIIKRAGPKGTSNAAVCRQTLGPNFRRLAAAMTGSISMPTNSQPSHLKHLSSTSQLSRIGKTMTYTFYATNEMPGGSDPAPPTPAGNRNNESVQPSNAGTVTATDGEQSFFSQPNPAQFSASDLSSLTEITRVDHLLGRRSKKSKRKRPINEDIEDKPTPKRRGRRPTRRIIGDKALGIDSENSRVDLDEVPSTPRSENAPEERPARSESPREPPRPPGVYRGLPNSINLGIKRKGRKPKSLILIFRSDKLKDPSFVGSARITTEQNDDVDSGETSDIGSSAEEQVAHTQETTELSVVSPPAAETPNAEPAAPTRRKKGKASKNKKNKFTCDKCGNSWKNSNGLEYHLTKSRTDCNPDYVPPPPELVQRKRKFAPAQDEDEDEDVDLPAPRPSLEERTQPRSTLTPREQMESRFDTKKRPQHKRSEKPATSAVFRSDASASGKARAADISHPGTPRGNIILKDLEVYDVADNRRLVRQGSPHTSGGVSLPKAHNSPYELNPSLVSDHEVPTKSPPSRLDSGNRRRLPPPRTKESNIATESANEEDQDLALSASTSPDDVMVGVEMGENLPYFHPSERASSTRKSLPSYPPKKMDSSRPIDTESHKTPAPDPEQQLHMESEGWQHMHKSLASFARPTRANATFGARRKERIRQIVEYLLDRNEGVFPGFRSLYMAVVSVWAKEFADLAPPDRRICQNTVNQMERDGTLKQMHFFFFDSQAKMQECVVLVKSETRDGVVIDSSDDPRVIAVKEKMREMFPEAYVPDAFSLSPDEAKLFDDLASQNKDYAPTRNLRISRDLKGVQDIETLRYQNSVMGDIFVNRHSSKRPADEAQSEVQAPAKRARVVEVEPGDTLDKRGKPRRRPEKHEMWDSGKLAVYIWSQRQKPSAMWEQHRCCLQDFNTGAWSWSPDIDTTPTENIATILSSVKSARYVDASLTKRRRRRLDAIDLDNDEEYDSRNIRRFTLLTDGDDLSSSEDDVAIFDEEETNGPGLITRHGLHDRIFITSGPATFQARGVLSDKEGKQEEEEEEVNRLLDRADQTSDVSTHASRSFLRRFVPAEVLSPKDNVSVSWPKLPLSFFGAHDATSFTLIGPMPNTLWFLKENLPRGIEDILKNDGGNSPVANWADREYGGFLRKLKAVKRWERSVEGTQLLTRGQITPDYIFISLGLEASRSSMKPLKLEWLANNQFTANNVPDEVKQASAEDEAFGLSYIVAKGQKRNGKQILHKKPRRKRVRVGDTEGVPRGNQSAVNQFPGLSGHDGGFIEYKTRDLTTIPRQPRGRFNKPAAHDDKLGSKREDELVAACVVFRTLLGGLDRNLDIGLLLKHFPGMSLSALKKFWPRISRERRSYVQALTTKFQSAFLTAYENGELPPLDYDDIENYDWPNLILWATRLETHEDIDLPRSRTAMHQKYTVEDISNEGTDWRETWFATTSTYNRIEAVASEAMSIPLPPKNQPDRTRLERARTWVRSICCTPLKGVNVKEKLVPKLLELGNGDAAETNKILEKVVAELNREKVITRTKGKDLGGNFRIHGMFSKQLEKMASTPKFRQAIAFKAQLDEVFGHSREYIMPYASDDGAVMAVLNLQAHGRIQIETVDMPNIPFGFEPGNYEGRTFPKSYYHFKVRLTPTHTYLSNDDMALLKQAEKLNPPTEAPGGKMPIWVDFFGKVDVARWADYVSMVVFTLAIKGPTTPKMCVTLLKPMIDEFEVQLIIDWLDRLGLLQRAVEGCGVTTAEWWWLVVGHIVQLSDRKLCRAG